MLYRPSKYLRCLCLKDGESRGRRWVTLELPARSAGDEALDPAEERLGDGDSNERVDDEVTLEASNARPDSVLIGAGEEGRCSFPAVTFTRFFWSGSWLGRSPDVGASYTRQRSFSLPL